MTAATRRASVMGFVDPAGAAAFSAVIDFDAERVGEEPEVGGLGPLGLGGEPTGVLADAGQVELSRVATSIDAIAAASAVIGLEQLVVVKRSSRAALQQAAATGAYAPLLELLAAPVRATVISPLP